MNPNIEEIKPNLFVKQDRKGNYRVVYPIRNSNGSINWRNVFLGDTNLFITALIIIAIVIGITFTYRHDILALQACWKAPCDYCINSTVVNLPKLNLPIVP